MGEVRCQGWLCSHSLVKSRTGGRVWVPERAQAAGKGQNMPQE